MGWGSGGPDRKGRMIGYYHEDVCNFPGCSAEIDRGLAYACGGTHGDETTMAGVWSCDDYFCYEHLISCWPEGPEGRAIFVCPFCKIRLDDYYVHRWFRAYEKDGDGFVKDVEFKDPRPGINELQDIFGLERIEPMYDCFKVEPKHLEKLAPYIDGELKEAFEWFLEAEDAVDERQEIV